MSILGTEMSCLYLITSGISFSFCINKWQCGGLYTGCVSELGDFATLLLVITEPALKFGNANAFTFLPYYLSFS